MGARSGHRLLHYELTQSVIGAFYAVYNELGYGFLEKVYENAMVHELRKRGYQVQQQALIEVRYDGQVVGQYFADLLIEGKVIVENKAADSIHESHEAQLVNYLKASHIEVGLLFNFGPKAEYRRKVFTNRSKQSRRR